MIEPTVPDGVVTEPERLSLAALDGFPLVATRYATRGGPGRPLVVGGATAVPQRFYRSFAAHAAARGWTVYTLDYRGIAGSAPRELRGFRMDYRDWGRLDLAALVEHASRDSADGRIDYVGHSYGGHALGLLPRPELVRAAQLLGTGSGWSAWMTPVERVRVELCWRVIGPVLLRAKGYLAWSRLRMGEDLPADVFHQWRRWCRHPGYWFDDPRDGDEMRALFARVTAPIVASTATDDAWIPARSRDAFVRHYTNAALTRRDIDPRTYGLARLGHLGYFRPDALPLWDVVLDELQGTQH